MKPYDDVERDEMARFFKAEIECDEHNAAVIAAMDKSHLEVKGMKTRLNLTKSLPQKWAKDAVKLRNWYKRQKAKPDYWRFGERRVWLGDY